MRSSTAFLAYLAWPSPVLGAPHVVVYPKAGPESTHLRVRRDDFDPTNSPFYVPDAAQPDSSTIAKLPPVFGSGPGNATKSGIPAVVGKRLDAALRKDIVLGWANTHNFTTATLRADWNDDNNTKVINFDDFHDAVEDIDCTAPSIYIDFSDDKVYATAKSEWSWVNTEHEYQIIAFTAHPKCGTDGQREPYRVHNMTFSDKAKKVSMTVSEVESYDDILISAELDIDSIVDPADILPPSYYNDTQSSDPFQVPTDGDTQQPGGGSGGKVITTKKRDITVNFNKDLPADLNIFQISGQAGNVSGSFGLQCAECHTRGYLRIHGHIKWVFLVPKQVYVDIDVTDVEAMMKLRLYADIELSKAAKMVLASPGIHVDLYKVIRLEAGVDIGVGGEIDVHAAGEVTFGTIGRMSDSLMRVCLWGCDSKRTGWSWNFEEIPPEAKGELGVDVQVYIFINPRVYVGAFGHGYEGGVAVLAPKFHGAAVLDADTQGGVCGEPDVTVGVEVEMDYGVEIYAYAGQDFQHYDHRWNIYSLNKPFFDKCFPLKHNSDHQSTTTSTAKPTVTATIKPTSTTPILTFKPTTAMTTSTAKPTTSAAPNKAAAAACAAALAYDWLKPRNNYANMQNACVVADYKTALSYCDTMAKYTNSVDHPVEKATTEELCQRLRRAIGA